MTTTGHTFVMNNIKRNHLLTPLASAMHVGFFAGRKVRVKCEPDDTVGELKIMVAALTGTRPEKLRIQRANIVYKDHITLA